MQARVEAAGKKVFDGRVCGDLAVARAFGDASFKQVKGVVCYFFPSPLPHRPHVPFLLYIHRSFSLYFSLYSIEICTCIMLDNSHIVSISCILYTFLYMSSSCFGHLFRVRWGRRPSRNPCMPCPTLRRGCYLLHVFYSHSFSCFPYVLICGAGARVTTRVCRARHYGIECASHRRPPLGLRRRV
jgi:hypothetical protein